MKRIKVKEEHINKIKEILDDIISGKYITSEATKIINQYSIQNNLPTLSDDTVLSIVKEIVSSNPKQSEQYNQTLINNIHSRHPHKISNEIKHKIIDEELPLILETKQNIRPLALKYGISLNSVKTILDDEMKSRGEEEYNRYKNITKKMAGSGVEARSKKKKTIERVTKEGIISIDEFRELSARDKINAIITKFLIVRNKQKHGLTEDNILKKRILDRVEWFIKRNENARNSDSIISQNEVLNMIYVNPFIIYYSIDDKIAPMVQLFEQFENIGFSRTSDILKRFPSSLGYNLNATRLKLEMLERNNLVEYVSIKPRILMISPGWMNALIEKAKTIYGQDLLDVNPKHIFITKSKAIQKYGMTYDELIEKYPIARNNGDNER